MNCSRDSQNAVALVITLAFVVLLTFVIVAFFSQATANRQIESASASRVAADMLAKSAADLVVGDLRTEIVAGSDRLGYPSEPPIYQPLDRANVIPSRVIADGAAGPAFENLIKQSVGRFFPNSSARYPNANPLIQADTGVTTDTPSANNRIVSGERWDMVMLTAPTTTPNPPAASNFGTAALPKWIAMSRDGVSASQAWAAAMKDYTPGNANAVIGRFAFNVYDIGGLLDVNAIALPPAITDTRTIQKFKATLTGADLAAVPSTPAIDAEALVRWKYRASLTTTSMPGAAAQMDTAWNRLRNEGFLKTWRSAANSDSMVLNRQDLIRLAALPSGYAFAHAGITTSALPHLTHFSREINAPSWWQYPIRVTKAFTSSDGTRLEVGEQVVRRFPLTKLNWLGPSGVITSSTTAPNGAIVAPAVPITAADVQRDFGLVWNTDHWVYSGPSSGAPLTAIGNIPNDRDPNFFELIAEAKRKTTGNADIAEILSIGASMIDHNDGPDTTVKDSAPQQLTSIEYLGPPPSPAPSPSPPNPRAWGAESSPSPYPSSAPSPPPKPVVLDHAIRSVGEFGYAYKADKTQTVDLFTSGSADREILDLFTMSPTRVRAGVVNLNTRNVSTLKAVLRKSLEDEESGKPLPDPEADAAATAILDDTNGNPLNPAQTRAAISRLATSSSLAGLEEKKELVARALGEVTQTRTWNLLIDVIAQSGQFPQRAKSHADFVVTGEQRYWLSIAIDRDSGEIIDRQLEAVIE